MSTWGRGVLSAQDYDELYRRQQGRDYSVKPKSHRSKDEPIDLAAAEKIRDAILAALEKL
jgi:hypothetical protein